MPQRWAGPQHGLPPYRLLLAIIWSASQRVCGRLCRRRPRRPRDIAQRAPPDRVDLAGWRAAGLRPALPAGVVQRPARSPRLWLGRGRAAGATPAAAMAGRRAWAGPAVHRRLAACRQLLVALVRAADQSPQAALPLQRCARDALALICLLQSAATPPPAPLSHKGSRG